MVIRDVVQIAAPVETVWALTLDVERWPSLSSTMTSVERLDDGPMVVGSRARIHQPHQRPRVWTVTTLDAPTRFEWETTVGPIRMVGLHHIEATAEGCRNHLGVRLEGPGARLAGLLLGRSLRTAIATENRGFRIAAESGSATSGGEVTP